MRLWVSQIWGTGSYKQHAVAIGIMMALRVGLGFGVSRNSERRLRG